MRLLILTQFFPPEMGAPQVRLSELGEQLIDRGWQVDVLTALPNYPTGRIFPGYSAWRPREEPVGRMRTVRVPLWPSKTGFLKRLITYFSFVLSACWFGPRWCRRPDLLLVESPPLFVAYAARCLSWWWRVPYVFNVSDLWPGSFVDLGILKPGFILRRMEALERSAYRHAAGVTGQAQEIVDAVRRRVPDLPTEVITNGVTPARFGRTHADAAAREILGPEPGPIFTYAGLLGVFQGLDQLLDLAQALPADVPGRLVLVGEGAVREQLAQRIERERLTRVRLVAAQPRERIPAILGASDVAIICLGMSITGAVPSKIYEAMASELPILLFADGEPARRVSEAGCGLCVTPGDAGAALAAFRRLATDAALRERLGSAGRQAAETRYDRRLIADRLDAFLRDRLPSRRV